MCNVIIPHFTNFPLLTQKRADFELFKQGVLYIKDKESLTLEDLEYLVSLRASMGKGLSGKLLEMFPNIKPADRPLVENVKNLNPNWVTGFAAGDGCFTVKASKTEKGLKTRIQLEFKITQHSRDQELMKGLIEFFNCGSIIVNQKFVDYHTTKFSDLTEIIMPFFEKYPIIGVKYLDFLGFVEVANLMKGKKHLTAEGLNKILAVKAGMNKGRYLD